MNWFFAIFNKVSFDVQTHSHLGQLHLINNLLFVHTCSDLLKTEHVGASNLLLQSQPWHKKCYILFFFSKLSHSLLSFSFFSDFKNKFYFILSFSFIPLCKIEVALRLFDMMFKSKKIFNVLKKLPRRHFHFLLWHCK